MPTYHVEMMEGRSTEQKKKLVEAITRVSVEILGGQPDSVDIIITDIKRENWATLGRVVEHSGLTVQEAQMAIEGYETAAREARAKIPDSLEALKQRVLAASTDGTLQAHIRRIVEENRQQAVQRAAA